MENAKVKNNWISNNDYILLSEVLEEEIPSMVVCPYCNGVTHHIYGATSYCVNCYHPINDGDVIDDLYEDD